MQSRGANSTHSYEGDTIASEGDISIPIPKTLKSFHPCCLFSHYNFWHTRLVWLWKEMWTDLEIWQKCNRRVVVDHKVHSFGFVLVFPPDPTTKRLAVVTLGTLSLISKR